MASPCDFVSLVTSDVQAHSCVFVGYLGIWRKVSCSRLCPFHKHLFMLYTYMYVSVHMYVVPPPRLTHALTHVEVSSLLLPCGFQGPTWVRPGCRWLRLPASSLAPCMFLHHVVVVVVVELCVLGSARSLSGWDSGM